MNQGGINNPALIGASQRNARNKLNAMAGINPPGGIMASSPQLMQAAMPARLPIPRAPVGNPSMMGRPMAPPVMPTTAPVAPVAPAVDTLPNLPMTTAVAPRSLNPMDSAVPTVPQPASPTTPMKFQDAGPVAVNPQFEGYSNMGAQIGDRARASVAAGGSSTVDITLPPEEFARLVEGVSPAGVDLLLKENGGPQGVKELVDQKRANIGAAVKTDDPKEVVAAVLKEAKVPNTDEGKRDFASTLGFDTTSISAIDDKIMEVLMAGQSTDLQQAVLLGLQNYKSTAVARSAAAADGVGGLGDAVDVYYELIGKQNLSAEEATLRLNGVGNQLGDRVQAAIAGGAKPSGGEPTTEPGVKVGTIANNPNDPSDRREWTGTEWKKL